MIFCGGWTRVSYVQASTGTVGYVNYQNFYTGDSFHVGINKFTTFNFTKAKLIFLANPNYSTSATYYKTITKNNVYQWFIYSGYEIDSTKTCTDYNMTQNCTTKGFDHDYNNDGISATDGDYAIFWGTGLEKYGYAKANYQPFHIYESNQAIGWCSTTANLNNNAWPDIGGDGHWGNGLTIYFK